MKPIERLELVKKALETLAPEATTTRDYATLDRDMHTQLNARIYCLVSSGFPRFGSLPSMVGDHIHDFIIIGQQKLLDTASGTDIEAMEFEMLNVIQSLQSYDFQTQDDICIELISAKGSMQLDHPYAVMACFLKFDDL